MHIDPEEKIQIPTFIDQGKDQAIAVQLQGKTYPVYIKTGLPSLEKMIQLEEPVRMLAGDNYFDYLEVNPLFQKDIHFSKDSSRLANGSQTMNLEAFAINENTDKEKPWKNYDLEETNLVDFVETYLANWNRNPDELAFVYYDPNTEEMISFHEHQDIVASSTYKLPVNMLIEDEIREGKIERSDRYPVHQTVGDEACKYGSYVNTYGNPATIQSFQETSLLYSSNVGGLSLMDALGGRDQAHQDRSHYGFSESSIRTITHNNHTTAGFLM